LICLGIQDSTSYETNVISKVRGSWHGPKELMQEGVAIWWTSKEVLCIELMKRRTVRWRTSGYLKGVKLLTTSSRLQNLVSVSLATGRIKRVRFENGGCMSSLMLSIYSMKGFTWQTYHTCPPRRQESMYICQGLSVSSI
jgi:hypothetical protein